MQQSELIEKIMNFGLTRQEALIYQYLIISGESTGYEVAKEVGISRSNAYNSLSSLADKGGAYLQNGATNKYVAVSINEFCGNKIRNLEQDRKDLEANLKAKEEAEGIEWYDSIVVNIEGKKTEIVFRKEDKVSQYDGKEVEFGEYLLPNERKHSNSTILYNPTKKLLITGSTAVNYFSCCKKEKITSS